MIDEHKQPSAASAPPEGVVDEYDVAELKSILRGATAASRTYLTLHGAQQMLQYIERLEAEARARL